MDKNIDLRISRTHKMIKEAFFELMDSIGFEKITVQALTKKAMISRTTFYLHYQDKYDLLDKIENEILDGLEKIATNLPVEEIAKNGLSTGNIFLLNVYNYIKENKDFFRLIMSENGDPSFYFKLNETMKKNIYHNIDANRLKIPVHYAIAFVMGFQTSVINEWINTGMKETPEEIVKMITQVMNDVPKNIYE